jgi:uracil phosphoribosyltransferase
MPRHPNFPTVTVVDHPVIQHKLTLMRDRDTPPSLFRQLLREIGEGLGYEVTRDLDLEMHRIETPLRAMEAPLIADPKITIVPILRAGLAMADGLTAVIPSARTGHIGLYRDEESKRPVEFLVRLPPDHGGPYFLVDPMIGTGHSSAYALTVLKRRGIEGARIRFMALLASPEGLQVIIDEHPDVGVTLAAVDESLDSNAFIVPGLGDAGDRQFGTMD